MTELKFFPISEWHITNCKSETDNRKYIVKRVGNKGKLFVMKGTEIMTDMAYGQFVSEFAILLRKGKFESCECRQYQIKKMGRNYRLERNCTSRTKGE